MRFLVLFQNQCLWVLHTRLFDMENVQKRFIITKKVAKHGSQSIIVIPRVLEGHLKPGTVMQLTIDVVEEAKHG